MELTMPLPWRHFSPASRTSHLEESIMMGTRRDVGLGRQQVQKRRHRLDRIEEPFVHVDVDDLGAALDLVPGDGYPIGELARLDDLGETGRAGHVRPLSPHSRSSSRPG